MKGDKVGLRARHEDDIPVLRAEPYDDVVDSSRAETGPWRPIAPGSKDPRLVVDDKKALENQWNSTAVRRYRAAEPSRLVKDVPLYTL